MARPTDRPTRASSGARSPAGSRLRLELELEPDGEPVAGVLRGGGVEESFFGWSGLARAIELALEARRRGAGGCDRADLSPDR